MKNGPYTLLRAPEDYPGNKYRGLYAYEHHLVWWQNTGLVVREGYQVHHKNSDCRDNRFENLALLTASAHAKIHRIEQKKSAIKFICGFCGKESERKGTNYRSQLKRSKYGKIFCSTSCGARHHYSSGVHHK